MVTYSAGITLEDIQGCNSNSCWQTVIKDTSTQFFGCGIIQVVNIVKGFQRSHHLSK